MSALPPQADIVECDRHVRFVPKADILRRSKGIYSITSSTATSKACGTVMPSALAVFRLMTSSNFVGCRTGRSAGFSPLSIAERWRSIKVTELERRQINAVKKELDQEYENQVDLKKQASRDATQAKLSSNPRT